LFSPESGLPQGWLEEYRQDFKHTPDIRTLEMGKRWFVFEYGECMEGKKEHKTFMEAGKTLRVGHAFTKFSNLIMYKKLLGEFSYPVVLGHMPKHPKMQYRLHQNKLPGRVKGDLFLVEGTDQIVLLDMARENGVAFKRVVMEVLFPYTQTVNGQTTEYLETVTAWVYIGAKDYWDNIIDDGYASRLVRRFPHVRRREYAEHVLGDYYYYSALEDDE
jgi:hypothetical protein